MADLCPCGCARPMHAPSKPLTDAQLRARVAKLPALTKRLRLLERESSEARENGKPMREGLGREIGDLVTSVRLSERARALLTERAK